MFNILILLTGVLACKSTHQYEPHSLGSETNVVDGSSSLAFSGPYSSYKGGLEPVGLSTTMFVSGSKGG